MKAEKLSWADCGHKFDVLPKLGVVNQSARYAEARSACLRMTYQNPRYQLRRRRLRTPGKLKAKSWFKFSCFWWRAMRAARA